MTTFWGVLIFSFTALLSDVTQKTETATRYSSTDAPPRNTCPHCGPENLIKNGSIHNGKPKQACKDCGQQGVYQQCAVAYTDFWQSYETVIPANRH